MTEEGTTTSTDELKAKLAQHIDAAKSKLEALKKDVIGLHEEDMETLRRRRDEINRRLDEQKERAAKFQSDIATWKREKVAHTKEAIATWRSRREIEKLEDRADRAEDYAIRLVNMAAIDFEEA